MGIRFSLPCNMVAAALTGLSYVAGFQYPRAASKAFITQRFNIMG
jgi:hypothetical protein